MSTTDINPYKHEYSDVANIVSKDVSNNIHKLNDYLEKKETIVLIDQINTSEELLMEEKMKSFDEKSSYPQNYLLSTNTLSETPVGYSPYVADKMISMLGSNSREELNSCVDDFFSFKTFETNSIPMDVIIGQDEVNFSRETLCDVLLRTISEVVSLDKLEPVQILLDLQQHFSHFNHIRKFVLDHLPSQMDNYVTFIDIKDYKLIAYGNVIYYGNIRVAWEYLFRLNDVNVYTITPTEWSCTNFLPITNKIDYTYFKEFDKFWPSSSTKQPDLLLTSQSLQDAFFMHNYYYTADFIEKQCLFDNNVSFGRVIINNESFNKFVDIFRFQTKSKTYFGDDARLFTFQEIPFNQNGVDIVRSKSYKNFDVKQRVDLLYDEEIVLLDESMSLCYITVTSDSIYLSEIENELNSRKDNKRSAIDIYYQRLATGDFGNFVKSFKNSSYTLIKNEGYETIKFLAAHESSSIYQIIMPYSGFNHSSESRISFKNSEVWKNLISGTKQKFVKNLIFHISPWFSLSRCIDDLLDYNKKGWTERNNRQLIVLPKKTSNLNSFEILPDMAKHYYGRVIYDDNSQNNNEMNKYSISGLLHINKTYKGITYILYDEKEKEIELIDLEEMKGKLYHWRSFKKKGTLHGIKVVEELSLLKSSSFYKLFQDSDLPNRLRSSYCFQNLRSFHSQNLTLLLPQIYQHFKTKQDFNGDFDSYVMTREEFLLARFCVQGIDIKNQRLQYRNNPNGNESHLISFNEYLTEKVRIFSDGSTVDRMIINTFYEKLESLEVYKSFEQVVYQQPIKFKDSDVKNKLILQTSKVLIMEDFISSFIYNVNDRRIFFLKEKFVSYVAQHSSYHMFSINCDDDDAFKESTIIVRVEENIDNYFKLKKYLQFKITSFTHKKNNYIPQKVFNKVHKVNLEDHNERRGKVSFTRKYTPSFKDVSSVKRRVTIDSKSKFTSSRKRNFINKN
jgi:hypothetical protein